MFTRPMNMSVLPNPKEQIELFSKERVVVFQIQSEEWKSFNERAATNDHFRSAIGEQIEGRKFRSSAQDRRR